MTEDGSVGIGDHQRLLSLLAQKARLDQEINAQLATLQPDVTCPIAQTSYETDPPPLDTQHGDTGIFSTTGSAMTRAASSRSQHAAPSLMNGSKDVASQGSRSQQPPQNLTVMASQIRSNSLLNHGGGSASFAPRVPWQNANRIESWQSAQDDPFCTIAPLSQSYNMSLLQPATADESDEVLLGFGEDPQAYLGRTTPPPSFQMYSTSGTSANVFTMMGHEDYGNVGLSEVDPITPYSSSLTTGTSFNDEMSRQDSLINDYPRSMPMLTINSNRSCYSDYNGSRCPSQPKLFSDMDQSSLLFGAGHALSVGTSDIISQPHILDIESADMRRSGSNGSNISTSSTSSTASRSKMQLARAIQLASRTLMPKVELKPTSEDIGPNASHALSHREESTFHVSRASAYVRPKHKRVCCDKCPSKPNFRGPHELSRHNLSKHSTVVKRFVCVEPAFKDANTTVRPTVPMHECKSCVEGKQYNIYYNAAAHLRRAHFAPSTKGRGRSKKGALKSPDKTIKANNEWPKMDDLKPWLQEIWATNPVGDVTNEDENEEEEGYDVDDDNDNNEDDQPYTTCDNVDLQECTSHPLQHSSFGSGDTMMADALPNVGHLLPYSSQIPARPIHNFLPHSQLMYGELELPSPQTQSQGLGDLSFAAYMGAELDLDPYTPGSSHSYNFDFTL